MKTVKLKVKNTEYKLKFGYGVFRRMAQSYRIAGVNQFFEFMGGMGFDGLADNPEGLSFEHLDFIGRLIKFAAENELGEEVDFNADDINDMVMKDPNIVDSAMSAFRESLPTQEQLSEGKTQPTQKRGRKKSK